VAGAAGVESDGENIQLTLRPVQRLQLSMSRQSFVTQSPTSHAGASANPRARVSGLSAGVQGPAGFQLHASYFDSLNVGSGQRRQATTVGVSRSIGGRLDVRVNRFQSRTGGYAATQFDVVALRQTLTRHFTLSQTITRNATSTTVSYGGQFSSNLLTFGAESQVVFLPFATAGHSGFQQTLQFTVRLRLPRDAYLNASSGITPSGGTSYTAYATAYAYGSALDPGARPRSAEPRIRFAKYEVRGRVVDEAGHGVFGAAVQVGEDLVFSDSEGYFSSRQEDRKKYSLVVRTDEFMFSGAYDVVSLPAVVNADVEERAQAVAIVLRRRR
jgi:hypothetical protein